MKPANITRTSARERSQVLTAHGYEVTVDLSGLGLDGEPLADPDTFLSTSTVSFSTTGASSHIDIIADEVLEAWLDDEEPVDANEPDDPMDDACEPM